MTEQKELDLIWLLEQDKLEKVAPKLEAFRKPAMIKVVRGGRAAGAKSWSIDSLLLQQGNDEYLPTICLREIQNTLAESVHKLTCDTIERLRYDNWKITDERIENKRTGTYWIFRGLKDMRASRNVKGLEGFKRFWVEEASSVSHDSWMLLLPTIFRTEGAELWISYNPEEELDPVTERIWNSHYDSIIRIEALPGRTDNPYWNEALTILMEEDYRRDPDEAEHVWGGQPRAQGERAIMSRVLVGQAMKREINPIGGYAVGVDPADIGKDRTEIYFRHGLKIIAHKELKHSATDLTPGKDIALAVRDMVKGDPSIPIKVDTTGIGTSARDFMRDMGLKVIACNFAESAQEKNKYVNLITEAWFNFRDNCLNECQIPDDQELKVDLSSRLYKYDNKNRYQVESKEDFRDRHKRSPDKGDALLLCFYEGATIKMDDESRKQMAQRRLNGR